MKMHRSLARIVVSLLVVTLSGLAWWAGVSATPVNAPITTVIAVSGIVSGQPESVRFSGQARISSELVVDTSQFHLPPAVILTIDLSNVSGTGSSTTARYVVGGSGENLFRQLASADTLEITFPFSRGTTMGMSGVRTGVVTLALSFDLNTGAITSGTGSIAAPNFPN